VPSVEMWCSRWVRWVDNILSFDLFDSISQNSNKVDNKLLICVIKVFAHEESHDGLVPFISNPCPSCVHFKFIQCSNALTLRLFKVILGLNLCLFSLHTSRNELIRKITLNPNHRSNPKPHCHPIDTWQRSKRIQFIMQLSYNWHLELVNYIYSINFVDIVQPNVVINVMKAVCWRTKLQFHLNIADRQVRTHFPFTCMSYM
jgi:hypothetical protein